MIDLQKRPSRRETLLFGIALLIFFFGFVKACWIPSCHVISSVKQQIKELEAGSGNLISDPGLRIPDSGLVGTAADLDRLPEHLTNSLITQGIQLTGSRFFDQESSGGLMQQRVELSASGSFGALGRYLQTLEEGQPPLVIDEWALTVSEGGTVILMLKGSAYGVP